MSDLSWIISVDDHVLEPPDLWQSRLAHKFTATGPRVRRQRIATGAAGWVESDEDTWSDVWHYDGWSARS